ncbi:HYD1 signature containing ADP-ribosyltransferase family protein [Escherichia coli]|uniref:HYD1 signature containing ADP-ribosyltransferase family protein n=1 Tax=Escherichia coli TaxID=562 RepID=UPI003A4C7E16
MYAYAPNPLKYIDPLGLKKELCNGTTRVRHYTNRKGSNAIAESGIIKAHDNGRVYLEPANKKPLSQVDIEASAKPFLRSMATLAPTFREIQ